VELGSGGSDRDNLTGSLDHAINGDGNGEERDNAIFLALVSFAFFFKESISVHLPIRANIINNNISIASELRATWRQCRPDVFYQGCSSGQP
jgi:hypothetical protein